ncbi:phosphatase domain-containing protein [Roseivivax sediminis]|uniref:Phosphatidate phosphatase APP1 n=1 Tax=Roseivivax sediminis TaxID=936889 RepID=A0A1I1UK73_9RHOB|nr:phosphatase domain-containing protein [Roseivivax sediminis]SFD70038.1 Phosphatidate phosphatase APP1 [Roseivivax sediminis]
MVKPVLARIAHPVEKLFDRVFLRREPERVVIDPYLGYATPEEILLRGRVLTSLRRTTPSPEASWWVNLRQMAGLFFTREVSERTIRVGEATAVSDEEGYFTLHLPRGDAAPGWFAAEAEIDGGESATLEALVVGDAPFLVISDIDDTVMETGAYSLVRNLWTSLTGNALTRHVFPDAVALMKGFEAAGAPIFFVSSSPWNLHYFLRRIFERHGLPKAPVFLRDLGISRTQFISGTHGDHKGAAIDSLLAAHPGVPVMLVGDTGQHDPKVYLAAAERHPGRIVRVILREPGKGADKRDRARIAALEDRGIKVDHGPSYDGFSAALPD